MNIFKVIVIGFLALVLNACGGGGSESKSSSSDIVVNAGEDKRVVINKTITIEGSVQADNKEELSYEWKENEITLATTKTFTYTPTMTGTFLLSFVVQNSDGTFTIDSMRVIVTNEKIDTRIVSISEALIEEYLTAVNQARVKEQDCASKGKFRATTAVVWNEKLYQASYEHIQDLIASKTFEHEGSGTESDWSGYALGKKSTQVERVESYGYSWRGLGENLAGGQKIDTATKAVEAWLKSDEHCENLMNPLFEEMGMVMIYNEDSLYTNYWGQNFGTPK